MELEAVDAFRSDDGKIVAALAAKSDGAQGVAEVEGHFDVITLGRRHLTVSETSDVPRPWRTRRFGVSQRCFPSQRRAAGTFKISGETLQTCLLVATRYAFFRYAPESPASEAQILSLIEVAPACPGSTYLMTFSCKQYEFKEDGDAAKD